MRSVSPMTLLRISGVSMAASEVNTVLVAPPF